MKPHFTDLTPEQQATFGNGCTWVPDFIFEKICRKHDWFYSIGCGANKWYENLWKAPYHKLSEDFRMGYFGIVNSLKLQHWFWTPFFCLISIIYAIGSMIFGWLFFTYGRWRTVEEVAERDAKIKRKCVL